jgi:acyl-CoA dehydrogenase
MQKKKSVLINPSTFEGLEYDPRTRQMMKDTIVFFERKGLKAMRRDNNKKIYQQDWIDYQGEHGIYKDLFTVKGYGDADSRFDLYRTCAELELLSFYSFNYMYSAQVTLLGAGPIWMSDNEQQKKELASALKKGGLAAFGMSEKEHGADLYSTECTITPAGNGKYVANGRKYYIGNSAYADKISVMGKNAGTGEFAFWVVDSKHRNFSYVKDILIDSLGLINVGEFDMIEYPLTETDILTQGDKAFANGLCTVNIGKFHVGFCSIGVTTHAFYEAITHASRRILYGKPVTNLPQIWVFLSEAFCRINAMRLYGMRARDYFRMMSENDRRYLLFNPIMKMKVCMQGAEVNRLMMDVVSVKGDEQDTYLSDCNAVAPHLPHGEGTAHVNMLLVLKFIKNYFFSNKDYPEFGIVDTQKDDSNIFDQTQGKLSTIVFADYKKAYEGVGMPNVKVFLSQAETFRKLVGESFHDDAQLKNLDFMMNYGEIFAHIVYAQIILESAKLQNIENDLIDQMFKYLVLDLNKYALTQLNTQKNTEIQSKYLRDLALIAPPVDKDRDFLFWLEYVKPLDGAYVMRDSVIGVD